MWNGGILVAGGLCEIQASNNNDDLLSQSITEFYNPKTNKWTFMPEMNYAR